MYRPQLHLLDQVIRQIQSRLHAPIFLVCQLSVKVVRFRVVYQFGQANRGTAILAVRFQTLIGRRMAKMAMPRQTDTLLLCHS